jgi:hypothetical protein
MNHRPECLPCCLRRVLHAAGRTTADDWLQRKVLAEAMQDLGRADPQAPPAELVHGVLRRAARTLGVPDPYAEEKEQLLEESLALEDRMRGAINGASDPLAAAARLAAAASWFDWELRGEQGKRPGLKGFLDELDRTELHGEALEDFRSSVAAAQSVVFVHASAGELLCDRLLIERLEKPRDHVVSVVRQSPILGWATAAEAARVRLEEVAQVLTPGTDCLGLPPNGLSEELGERLRKADLVIAKGQASYETLGDHEALSADEGPTSVFFLLRIKCSLLARHLGAAVGDCVLETVR